MKPSRVTSKSTRARFLRASVVITAAACTFAAITIGGCASTGDGEGGGFSLGELGQRIGDTVGGRTGQTIKGGSKALEASVMDERHEPAMGQSVAVAVSNRYGLDNDEALNRYVTLVGLTVAYVTPRADEEFVFGVLDSDEVNAFSGPAGYILVTRGAIQQCQDESELAGILAHEIAHVVHQHGLKAVKRAGQAEGIMELAQTQEDIQKFGIAADSLVDIVVNKGYSRDQETDADSSAVQYLIAAGYDPAGYQRFLQRVTASGTSASGLQQLMSTHPGLGDRAAKVSEQIRKAGNPSGATLATRFRQHVPQPAG